MVGHGRPLTNENNLNQANGFPYFAGNHFIRLLGRMYLCALPTASRLRGLVFWLLFFQPLPPAHAQLAWPEGSARKPLRILDLNKSTPTATPASSISGACRFRVNWGGGQPQRWKGSIQIDSEHSDTANFKSVTPLAMEIDSATAALQQSPSTISIQTPDDRQTSGFDGFEFEFQGPLDTPLFIQMTPQGEASNSWQRTVSVQQLIDQAVDGALDFSGNQITIARAPGDQVAVNLPQDHLVLTTSETFEIGISANHSLLKNGGGTCRVTVVPARKSTPSLWSKTFDVEFDASGNTAIHPVSIEMPSYEGAFDIVIEMQKNWLGGTLATGVAKVGSTGIGAYPVRRRVQVIALDSNKPVPSIKGVSAFSTIGSIAPADVFAAVRPWRLAKLAPLGQRNDVFSNQRSALLTRDNRSWVELSPGGWQAIRLPIERPNQPHILEVEYPDDQAMALGIVVVDRDAPESAIGAGAGIFVPETIIHQVGRTSSEINAPAKKHRFSFWPQSKNSYVYLINQSNNQSATFGHIEVLAGPNRLDVGLGQTAGITSNFVNSKTRQRLAFLELNALLGRPNDSPSPADPQTRPPVDDWRSFYQSANRLIQQLKTNHYQGAVISTISDGGGIYPSRLQPMTPRGDRGILQSDGQDPVRKDVLRMLLRMFQREGLTLVPSLTFNGPLANIERQRAEAADAQAFSFDLTDYAGNHPTANNSNVPRYNPLAPIVQQSIVQTTQEITRRYAEFDSLGGIAIVCRPDSYTMLPGQQWCYQQSTIARFFQSANRFPVVLASADSDLVQQAQSLIFGKHQQDWLQWRTDQMTALYKKLANVVDQSVPGGKLFLAPVDIYQNAELFSAMCPNLHATSNFEKMMQRIGFDIESLGSEASIVLLDPQTVGVGGELAARRAEIYASQSDEVRQFFAGAKTAAPTQTPTETGLTQTGLTGTLFVNPGQWESLEAPPQPTWPIEQHAEMLMQQVHLTPAAMWNRQRLAVAMGQQDSDYLIEGGQQLLLGQSESLASFSEVFSRLPQGRFETVSLTNDNPSDQDIPQDDSASPVVVRQRKVNDHLFFYAVNRSPLPVKVTLNMVPSAARENWASRAQAMELQSFAELPFQSRPTASGVDVVCDLPPFGMFGGQANGRTSISGYQIKCEGVPNHVLRRKIYKLQAKLNLAKTVAPMNVLQNSSFDASANGHLAGWDFGNQPIENVSPATDTGYESPSSLKIQSDGPPVWVRSNSFPIPTTGRLSVTVWLKAVSADAQPPLRISVEGRTNTATYYRFGAIGSLATDPSSNQVNGQWRKFAVHFDDLPTEPDMQLRVGFDLMGAGTVWLDQVQVFDRWFDANDNKAITQLLASAVPLLNRPKSFNRCRLMLESYWPQFLDRYIDDASSSDTVRQRVPADKKRSSFADQQATENRYDIKSKFDLRPNYIRPRTSSLLKRWKKGISNR